VGNSIQHTTMTQLNHKAPSLPIAIGDGDIHIWKSHLDLSSDLLRYMWETLSADERDKAHRYVFEKDRNESIASRGLLRAILSCYLQVPPKSQKYRYNEYGKPFLNQLHDSCISFNLSHSRGIALFAIAAKHNIGIDIEALRYDIDILQMAEVAFSLFEINQLLSFPPSMRHRAFFNGWTRKEAYIKAIGCGISIPLDSFAVSLTPGGISPVINIAGSFSELSPWSVYEIEIESGYVAALAIDYSPSSIAIIDADETWMKSVFST